MSMIDLCAALLGQIYADTAYPVFTSPTVVLFSICTAGGWVLLTCSNGVRDEDWSNMLVHLPDDQTFDPGEVEPISAGWDIVFIQRDVFVEAGSVAS